MSERLVVVDIRHCVCVCVSRAAEVLHCGFLWNWKSGGLHTDIHAGLYDFFIISYSRLIILIIVVLIQTGYFD